MLSVVIPVLNGGEGLLATLRAVMPDADETIVVDGGSTDQSVDMAEAMEVTLVSAPPVLSPAINQKDVPGISS